ncbi:MAG: pyridoxal-phosphate dependent enzyme [Solirubrobacteraceae bacterium]
MAAISVDDVHRAAARIDGVAHRTPVLSSATLDERLGAHVSLKAETFQRGGAFKFRGAYNALSSLDAETLTRGVCAVSSGNHAQAISLAARMCGTRATILMPADAPALKRAATEAYGAEVITFDRYVDDREQLVRELAARRGLRLVHPFDDPLVMAGQGTVALELLDEVDGLDVITVPVGGGGLLSGCATVCAALAPGTRIIGVEPEASDDTARSLASGRRERVTVGQTIADGQQTASPGELTWPIIQATVDAVVTVSDAEIVAAMRFLFERCKLVVEPSGASAFAALLAGKLGVTGLRVGVVLSGGNVGVDAFARLMRS